MSIAEFSVNRPVTTIMIIVSVVTLGMISYTKLPLMFLPDMSFPSLNVSVPYPSSLPEEVERLITRPLEDAFGTLSNMKSMESRSSDDNARVRIEFETGTDMNMAAMEVRDRIDQVRGELPDDVERISIRRWNPNDMPIYNFSVAWSGDPAEFYNIVTKVIQPRIQRVDGVANVEISGMIDKQLLVHVDSEKLQSHNLDLFNLSQTLTQNNVTLTAGTVTEGGKKYSVRSVNEYRAAEEVANLPIPGTTLSLRDVAEVKYDYPENDSFQRLNGVDAVTIRVYKTSTANIVDVAQRTQSVLDELQTQPQFADLETRVFFDQSQSITDRLSDLRNTGLLGGMLAVIVLFLFLRNVRSTMIIGLAIPISIICTFTFMYLLRQGA
ncbi:MAG: efflux RND transporter permease subunit, partial [Gemmatimonadota bacterium]|nr:efflux RND transporter permease subunit [Gemmatimonadota bacterium]